MLGGERDPALQMRECVSMGGVEKFDLRNRGVRNPSRVKYV